MNIRDLKYFIAVAETKHFGQAAEKCFVSQPTLSMQLRKLEEGLGVQLFERTNKSVMITPIGEAILIQARRVLQEVEQLQHLAANAQDPFAGNLRVGIIPTLGPYLLPGILKNLQRAFPNLELIIHENKTERLLRELRQGTLDAAILAQPIPQDKLMVQELFHEKFLIALPHQHDLQHKKQIAMDELENESLLLLNEGHCLRDQALEACRFSGAIEKEGFRATSLETLRHLVAAGHGITLLPEMSIRASAANPLIALRPFAKPEPYRTIVMAWRENAAREECCQAVANEIMNMIAAKVRE